MVTATSSMSGGQFSVTDDGPKERQKSTSSRVSNSNPTTEEVLQSASKILDSFEDGMKDEPRLLLEEQLAKLVKDELSRAEGAVRTKDRVASKVHFQNIIEIISDALREGYPQAWMYEALSLSMQACDYPTEDIKRVLLSSVDFSGDVKDLQKIAKYLLGRGMKAEALAVLEDIHRCQPLLAEPLEMALPIAVELKDLEGERWACLGVLSQAWNDDKLKLVEDAQLAAQATYARLIKAKRTIEAAAFQKEVNQALARDLAVRVTWSGNADVDLVIEEPSGSVCSLSNQRTMGGGMLLGDGSPTNINREGTCSETYVCPQGFSGKYRIKVGRVWGDISTGKVTVDILTDYGTPDQKYGRQQIPLSDKDALIDVEVKIGHREIPLVAAQIAQAEATRVNAGRLMFANDYSRSTSASPAVKAWEDKQQLIAQGVRGFAGRGAVGYQPVLTVLPQGATMTTRAVITGDRKYVRISPAPNFTAIIEVATFNFVSGSGTNNGGGGAGGGAGGGGFGGGIQ